eukprot:TRINITY_DN22850_c0_g1_i1.p1 TRINITY_DN22850_c0_g1~~TRINITY_DN22850_c0_g1_i1.p1  ORF type:complete len:227 (-),score=28.59 TRINITY_DN22850_c0_g1_i1:34-714(-)
MTNFSAQLKALLYKQWIVWKRNWCGSLMEILIPALVALILIGVRAAVTPSDLAETSYTNQRYPAFPPDFSTRQFAALPRCNAKSKVALSPPNIPITLQLKTLFDSLNYTTKFYQNGLEMDDFMKSEGYGETETICFGVAFSKADGTNFEYSIKMNATGNNNNNNPNGPSPIPNTFFGRVQALKFQDQSTIRKYFQSGFLQLQTAVDNIILRSVSYTHLTLPTIYSV